MVQEQEWVVNEAHGFPVGTVFSIPPYQRGYRWTGKEVEALLDDLEEFGRAAENVYCLQPLVVQAMADGKFNVVDGQQRLTTLAIILRALGMECGWDIEYTAEGGKRLGELLETPGKGINDHFRKEAQTTVESWLEEVPSRVDALRGVFRGENGKRVVFLRYDLPLEEDGHDAFKRLNAGKTALTSSELVRALFMEAGNGLSKGEKADIAKEWDGIETAMENEEFWAIWPAERFRDVPTRMDYLFSVVADVSGEKARQDSLAVYRAVEDCAKAKGLQTVWEEVLRCWWWMQSCHMDTEAHHLLGWISLFPKTDIRKLYRELWCGTAARRMEVFKKTLRKIVAEEIGEIGFDSFRYGICDSGTLKKVFVLLNMLEAQRQGIRFRFNLFRAQRWDVEHIASQTDNPMSKKEEREEWLSLARREMSTEESNALANCMTFEEQRAMVWQTFENRGDVVSDKDGMGNLALLDEGTNRSYKNAIFPAKRRRVLLEAPGGGVYVPPCTVAAFAKAYSPAAAQMRYWSEADDKDYRDAMEKLFKQFMEESK